MRYGFDSRRGYYYKFQSMKNQIDQVATFHKTFGQPVVDFPAIPDPERLLLRSKLVKEEAKELAKELEAEDPLLENILKESIDLLYVTFGTLVELGLGSIAEEAFAEVHRSNMSKVGLDGNPIKREDGKILKGPNYTEANIEKILKKAVPCTMAPDWAKVLNSRKKFQLDATFDADSMGGNWQRRMWAFDRVRKKYPGQKGGLLIEFNRLLAKCQKMKFDLDLELSKMLYAILYQTWSAERREAEGEFAAPWKNFQTWINNACWQDEMPGCGKAQWFTAHCSQETKIEVERIKKLIP